MNAQREDRETSTPAPLAVTPIPASGAEIADKPITSAEPASPGKGEQPPSQALGYNDAVATGESHGENGAVVKPEPTAEQPVEGAEVDAAMPADGMAEEVPMTTEATHDPMDAAPSAAAEPVPVQAESEDMGSPPAPSASEADDTGPPAFDCTQVWARRNTEVTALVILRESYIQFTELM